DPDLVRLLEEADDAMGVHHLAVVRVRERDQVRAELARRGVATGVHYPTPCHVMTPYAGYCSAPLPVAEAAATEILSLPMYPHLAAGQAELVCTEINAVTLEVAPR
ncbi:MAG: hypothetical protein QOI51_2524, partial [Nocardioidaceae bacterium]|nr:hypothetical protein [Nocardioidaceae bacterium]